MADAAWWTLHMGDCLRFLEGLPDRSVDHVVTDPPYEAEAHTKQRRVRRGPGDRNAKVEPLDFEPITENLRELVSREIARVVRRWAIVFCQAEAVSAWKETMEAGGLSWRRSCVWVKPDGMPQLTGDRPGMGYESIATAHVKGRSRWNGGGRVGVFIHNKSDHPGEKAEHPTTKPLPLMLELLELFTDPGELVLDPFTGSGTTGVAALRLGRRFVGCELDPKYHALASERLAAEAAGTTVASRRAGQLTIFGGA